MGAPRQHPTVKCIAGSYFEMCKEVYGTKAEGLRRLNEALGTSYGFGHISRWERGERDADRPTRLFMLRFVLPWELRKLGFADDPANGRVLNALAERLT